MQGFTQALFASTVFHLILSLKCSWGDWGHCKLWLKPLKMAIFSGCYIWCSSCIITSNIQDFPILRFHVYTPTIFLLTNLLFKNMKCFQLKKALISTIICKRCNIKVNGRQIEIKHCDI